MVSVIEGFHCRYISLISESVLHALLPQLKLQKSAVTLRTYIGEVVPVKGFVVVDVSYASKTYSYLKLVVVCGDRVCLIGHDWLSRIRLNWRKVGKILRDPTNPQERLDDLLSQYQDVFSDSLGSITPYKAT